MQADREKGKGSAAIAFDSHCYGFVHHTVVHTKMLLVVTLEM